MPLRTQYEFLVFLLLAVLVLEFVGRKLKLPPAASFITGGMALALFPDVPKIQIDPDLVMVVFLPPLLMSGAYFTLWKDFKAQLRGIASLAFGAVVFTTACVATVLHLLLPGLPLAVCFAIGAIVSPPDAVAATAVLRNLNLPNRLLSLLEGESLVNDATGLVLFGIAVASATTGLFSVSHAIGWFFWLAITGTAIGLVTGWIGVVVIRRLGETELVITATLLLSAASYISAEAVGGSGVLATVASGLVVSWHQHDSVSASTRVRAHSFWKALVFIMESFLFILIGLSIQDVLSRLSSGDAHALFANAGPVAAVVVTVVIARFLWLAMCAAMVAVTGKLDQSWRNGIGSTLAIIGWSGMRGVVTLTAALSFPANLPGRDLVLLSAFAVIVVTVFIQGSTLAPLARLLGVGAVEERRVSGERRSSIRRHLASLRRNAINRAGPSEDVAQTEPENSMLPLFGETGHVTGSNREQFAITLKVVREARTELLRLYAAGFVHDHILREIVYELDLEEMAAENRLSHDEQ